MKLKIRTASRWIWVISCLNLAGCIHTVRDGFEGRDIKPFWTLTQQNGTIQLSSKQTHSGKQSVSLTAMGDGQHNSLLSHTFPHDSYGTLSVWFFDTGDTPYAGLYANASKIPQNDFATNVADFDALHYIWHGLAVGETRTPIMRTPGWHKLELQLFPTGFKTLVDNVITGSGDGDCKFETVILLVSGPGPRNGTFYFDDFLFKPR